MRVLALVAVVMVAACVTPYQPMGFAGGYRDQQMGEGKFFVHVRVNGYTSRGTAHQYLLRRAQELCTAAGYDDFEIRDGQSGESISLVRTGNSLHVVDKPEMSAVVACTRAAPARPAVAASWSGPPSAPAKGPAPYEGVACPPETKLVPLQAATALVPDGVTTPAVLDAASQFATLAGFTVEQRDDSAGTLVTQPFDGQLVYYACPINAERRYVLGLVVQGGRIVVGMRCRESWGWDVHWKDGVRVPGRRDRAKDCGVAGTEDAGIPDAFLGGVLDLLATSVGAPAE